MSVFTGGATTDTTVTTQAELGNHSKQIQDNNYTDFFVCTSQPHDDLSVVQQLKDWNVAGNIFAFWHGKLPGSAAKRARKMKLHSTQFDGCCQVAPDGNNRVPSATALHHST